MDNTRYGPGSQFQSQNVFCRNGSRRTVQTKPMSPVECTHRSDTNKKEQVAVEVSCNPGTERKYWTMCDNCVRKISLKGRCNKQMFHSNGAVKGISADVAITDRYVMLEVQKGLLYVFSCWQGSLTKATNCLVCRELFFFLLDVKQTLQRRGFQTRNSTTVQPYWTLGTSSPTIHWTQQQAGSHCIVCEGALRPKTWSMQVREHIELHKLDFMHCWASVSATASGCYSLKQQKKADHSSVWIVQNNNGWPRLHSAK